MAALVAVMVFVAYATFDWHSVAPSTLRRMPRGETAVMLSTVLATVATDNLAIGVGVGVVLSMALFARRAAGLVGVDRLLDPDGTSVLYRVRGELSFGSGDELQAAFAYAEDPGHVVIDLSAAHLWDTSGIAALEDVRRPTPATTRRWS